MLEIGFAQFQAVERGQYLARGHVVAHSHTYRCDPCRHAGREMHQAVLVRRNYRVENQLTREALRFEFLRFNASFSNLRIR